MKTNIDSLVKFEGSLTPNQLAFFIEVLSECHAEMESLNWEREMLKKEVSELMNDNKDLKNTIWDLENRESDLENTIDDLRYANRDW